MTGNPGRTGHYNMSKKRVRFTKRVFGLGLFGCLLLSAPLALAADDPDQFGKGGCLMRVLNTLRGQNWRFETVDQQFHMDIQPAYHVIFSAFPVSVKRTLVSEIGQPNKVQFDVLWSSQQVTNCLPPNYARYTIEVNSKYTVSESETVKLANLEDLKAAADARRLVHVVGRLRLAEPEVRTKEFLRRERPPMFQKEELTSYPLELITVNGREFESLRDR
jgi:hypothetical protein